MTDQELIYASELPEVTDGSLNHSLKRNWKSLLSLAFGYFIDQGEGQSMSVLFPTLQQLWGLSYTNLGTIGTIRSILQAISAPFWGYAADKMSRKKVIIFGTGIWGIWTGFCGFTQNFGQLLTIRAISGLGLGCLMPAVFSLMSDLFPPKQRGKALGILEAFGVLGIIIGTVGLSFLATPALWRWGFFLLGAFSILTGLVVYFFVDEPVRGAAEPELAGKITKEDAAKYGVQFGDIFKVLKIPTVWVAILQGLAGSMPWVVMGLYFITFLVNERGMEEQTASLTFATIVIGTALSNIIGGFLGDWAEEKNPKYGRVIVGQISILSGIPLSWILFTQTADWPLGSFMLLCLFTALMISWPGKGAKEPMMQGAVPPELRSTAFAMTTFIESGFAAIAAWVAGSLADRIGLTAAMIWTVPVPWILCGLLFSLFYWAYPRDSKQLREAMAQRAREISHS
ncbi:MAG: MFS transporter [Anaerolineaceae bacterium]|nr:MFS transporter [Anaerolineaceae bacterium]